MSDEEGTNMQMKSRILLVVAAIAVLCFAGWNSKAQRSSERWEYEAVTTYGHADAPPDMTQLKNLGLKEWELVAVLSEQSSRAGIPMTKFIYYFKRRL
jgi:hypothetical protein